MSVVVVILMFCSVAQDEARAALYWSTDQSIERMNLDGSYRSDIPDPTGVFTGGFLQPIHKVCGLAADATHIYWANSTSNEIGRANLDGTERKDAFIVGADEPCGVAVDATHIYWANGAGRTIGRANLDGSGVDQRFIEGENRPCGVAVNLTNVFWGNVSSNFLSRANLDGKNVSESFITEAGGGCGIAVAGSHIFWTDLESVIGRANLDGTDVNREFITGLDWTCSLAADATHIYWTEETFNKTGSVGRASLDGTEVTRGIVNNQLFPCGIAVNSLSFVPPRLPVVPLSSFRFGALKRIRKTGIALLAVFLPAAGHVVVETREGLSWHFVSEGVGPALSGGKKWLKISPKRGYGVYRRLRRKGRAGVRIRISYTEVQKAPIAKTRSLELVWKRRARHVEH